MITRLAGLIWNPDTACGILIFTAFAKIQCDPTWFFVYILKWVKEGLIGPPAVIGRVLWIRICPYVGPSIYLSICSGSFLGIGSLVFLKPCMVLGTHMEMCMKGSSLFWKNPLPAKMTKNGPRIRFSEFLGKSIY